MPVQKTALPKRVRVVKYFETLQDGEKVCVAPSPTPMDAPEDQKVLQELLTRGVVVSADEPDEEESEDAD